MKNIQDKQSSPIEGVRDTQQDPIIDMTRKIVTRFESGRPIDIVRAKEILTPFLSHIGSIHRYLTCRGEDQLYDRLLGYKKQIHSIQTIGVMDAVNDRYYLMNQEIHEDHIGASKKIPLPARREIIADISLLFKRHFLGLEFEDYNGDTDFHINLLTTGICYHHEYEMRLAEYFADITRFQRDFIPGIEKFTI